MMNVHRRQNLGPSMKTEKYSLNNDSKVLHDNGLVDENIGVYVESK